MSGNQQLLLGQSGGGSSVVYVENVHSTYAYTGTASPLSIVNNIDLATKGGLTWLKNRTNATDNSLFDTLRGVGYRFVSNTGSAQNYSLNYLYSFNTDGFSIGAPSSSTNANGDKYISWSFAEQPKFFDVVSATRSNNTNARIPHSLGSVPGMVIVKANDYEGESWRVYHRSLPSPQINYGLQLNLSDSQFNYSGYWGTEPPTSTDFGINWYLFSGTNYTFYFFAHDAGGFGELGTDSIVYCGVYNGTGQVDIGFEPQWILTKATSISTSYTGDWRLFDTIRGIYAGIDDAQLFPNTSGAENSGAFGTCFTVNATGFVVEGQGYNGSPVIYVAIRKGPMKVPTTGSSVYSQTKYTGDGSANRTISTGFPLDTNITRGLDTGYPACWGLRKTDGMGETNTGAVTYQNLNAWIGYDNNTNLVFSGSYSYSNASGVAFMTHSFLRAPKFHDVQTWIGTGSNNTISHNLTIPPELIIIKNRAVNSSWPVYCAALGNTKAIDLNNNSTSYTYNYWQNTTPTNTTFKVTSAQEINGSGNEMQAIMFATCAGVSKVGSFTGNGSSQTIDCGFLSGSRFIIIKASNNAGGWYAFSTANSLSNYYYLDTNTAQTIGAGYVSNTNVGFVVSGDVNQSGISYIFVAIA